jgi:hypothetical protein
LNDIRGSGASRLPSHPGAIATDAIVTDAGVKNALWWLGLVVAPAVLIAIELFHPAHFTAAPGMYRFLSQAEPYDSRFVALAYPGPQWWFTLHMIQTPLIGLVAVGLWLLVAEIGDGDRPVAHACAWLSRAAPLVFLVYYTALDSIGGTGLGRLLLNLHALAAQGHLTPDQVNGMALLLDTNWADPWVGGVGSLISEIGSWAVLAAAVFAAAALKLTRRAPWPVFLLVLAFGWQLQTSHASPHGPIAFALLIAAALWLRWSRVARLAPADPIS